MSACQVFRTSKPSPNTEIHTKADMAHDLDPERIAFSLEYAASPTTYSSRRHGDLITTTMQIPMGRTIASGMVVSYTYPMPPSAATAPEPASDLPQTFHGFMKLSPELCRNIYRLAASRRVLELVGDMLVTVGPAADIQVPLLDIKDARDLLNYIEVKRCQLPAPATQGERPQVNYDFDIIYFVSTATSIDYLGEDSTQKVKYVAMPFDELMGIHGNIFNPRTKRFWEEPYNYMKNMDNLKHVFVLLNYDWPNPNREDLLDIEYDTIWKVADVFAHVGKPDLTFEFVQDKETLVKLWQDWERPEAYNWDDYSAANKRLRERRDEERADAVRACIHSIEELDD